MEVLQKVQFTEEELTVLGLAFLVSSIIHLVLFVLMAIGTYKVVDRYDGGAKKFVAWIPTLRAIVIGEALDKLRETNESSPKLFVFIYPLMRVLQVFFIFRGITGIAVTAAAQIVIIVAFVISLKEYYPRGRFGLSLFPSIAMFMAGRRCK